MKPENNIILSVTGLGYVGLPLALEFAKQYKVIGFDINKERIALMQQGIDPSNELTAAAFENTNITFTSNFEEVKEANFHIIGVPTDIDKNKVPDLKHLLSASKSIGKIFSLDFKATNSKFIRCPNSELLQSIFHLIKI